MSLKYKDVIVENRKESTVKETRNSTVTHDNRRLSMNMAPQRKSVKKILLSCHNNLIENIWIVSSGLQKT